MKQTKLLLSALILHSSVVVFASENQNFGFNFGSNSSLVSSGKLQSMVDQARRSLTNERFRGISEKSEINYLPSSAAEDQISSTLKYVQTYKNLEVYGEKAMFHYDTDGILKDLSGRATEANLSTTPNLSSNEASKILNDTFQTNFEFSNVPKLIVYFDPFTSRHRLVYSLETKPNQKKHATLFFVDAHDGSILLDNEKTCEFVQKVYDANTPLAKENTDAFGFPTEINLEWYKLAANNKLPSTLKADIAVNNAFNNTKLVYNYYLQNFNRHSYDDKDSEITSIVHAGDRMNNAFWDGYNKVIAYGDGDGDKMTDLSKAIDVAGHELTHAITSSTASLVMKYESGALNESFSDFFGKMIENKVDDWKIGASIVGPALIGKGRTALRDMKNPESLGMPASNDSSLKVPLTTTCNRENDRCGVHKNSGIPNRASVLIYEAIGKEKTQKLYYNVLTQRLTETSDFSTAKTATIAACIQLFGKYTDDCTKVTQAFETVKM